MEKTTSENPSQLLTFSLSNNEKLQRDHRLIRMSVFLKNMLEEQDVIEQSPIPLENINRETFELICKYCELVEYEPEGRVTCVPIKAETPL
jgi:Skp1 family, tetramerisation domain